MCSDCSATCLFVRKRQIVSDAVLLCCVPWLEFPCAVEIKVRACVHIVAATLFPTVTTTSRPCPTAATDKQKRINVLISPRSLMHCERSPRGYCAHTRSQRNMRAQLSAGASADSRHALDAGFKVKSVRLDSTRLPKSHFRKQPHAMSEDSPATAEWSRNVFQACLPSTS